MNSTVTGGDFLGDVIDHHFEALGKVSLKIQQDGGNEVNTEPFVDRFGNLAVADPDHITQVNCFDSQMRTDLAARQLVLASSLNAATAGITATGRVTINHDAGNICSISRSISCHPPFVNSCRDPFDIGTPEKIVPVCLIGQILRQCRRLLR